jgi:hypothetical protein
MQPPEFGALHGEGQGLVHTAAPHDELHRGAGRSADQTRHLVERQSGHNFFVDLQEHVASAQASLLGRRVVVDLHDTWLGVARIDADANPDVSVIAA